MPLNRFFCVVSTFVSGRLIALKLKATPGPFLDGFYILRCVSRPVVKVVSIASLARFQGFIREGFCEPSMWLYLMLSSPLSLFLE